VRSKVCDSGRKDRKTSSGTGVMRASTALTSAMTLPCVSITPLGLPVVPLV
jgi:hypothetical protein